MMLYASLGALLKSTRSCQHITKRFKAKRNKHSSRLKKEATQLALEHFDAFYEPVFRDKWHSIRLALLSPQKYCALVNNFADSSETIANLISDGAENILKLAESTEPSYFDKRLDDEKSEDTTQMPPVSQAAEISHTIQMGGSDADLYTFMPTKRVGSEIERMKEEERALNIPVEMEISTKTLLDTNLTFPRYLKAYAYERGNTSLFHSPKRDSTKKKDYYLYDAASILPVLALELFPDCRVLDLCAAPGGKTLTMLQTHLLGEITCVDISHTRLQRLSEIMAEYIPGKKVLGSLVKVFCSDGVVFCKRTRHDLQYDRVLVDVPCNNDRHVLEEPDNNLFKPSRIKDRIQLPKIQRDLLYHGILACKPEGTVVYSTCTLSPVQNDGVIQATLERIWTDTKIELAVVDIKHMANRFREIYHFADNTRFGLLVVPNVTTNFGPMYVCKMKRLN